MCWLANNQGTESLALAAATLIHFPIQRGKHPSPAPSTLQPGMRSPETWAKTWSSHAETDGGAWGMVQVEPRKPCQCTHLAAGGPQWPSSVSAGTPPQKHLAAKC